ncbi:MAG: hypothetical protein ACOYNY_01835 [Caldilineaceae bacterium]
MTRSTNNPTVAGISVSRQPARPLSSIGGLPMRTNLRAGVGEDALAQVQAWWQTLVNSLTSNQTTNNATQTPPNDSSKS